MSDDSFVKEVDDDLRTDKFKSLWSRYGILLAGAALTVVLGTAAYEGYKYWKSSEASKSGDLFLAALTQANDQKQDEALKSLSELEKSGYGSYPVLARMRSATVLATKGDAKAAIATFEAISADASVDAAVRDMARLRAALLLVDNGTYEEVAKHAEVLTADTNAMRHSAREALGLAAWKAGKFSEANG
ncbi:MAG: tetratricopeptide repeat protein, partial [Rhizobiaceae bacterium]